MEKTVLISESESLIGKQLIDNYLSAGYKIIAPVSEKADSDNEEDEENGDMLSISWNKTSVFSTKTIIREGIRRFKKIDEAIIIFPSPGLAGNFSELTMGEIEEILENYVNGTVYITKELIDYYEKNEKGLLSFALFGDINQAPSALASGVMGFFRYFIKGILEKKKNNIFQAAYYSQDQTDYKGFADFIYKYNRTRLDKAEGQWLKFTDKKSLFSSLPVIKKDL